MNAAAKLDWLKRLLFSFTQDVFLAVPIRKNITSKNLYLVLQIKLVTNYIQFITTASGLRHGMSYTNVFEINTEVTYSISNKRLSGMVCIPE